MGAAIFIVLERKIDGVENSMDGKNLARHIESLDEAARQLGVRPLSDFFNIDPQQATEFLDGEGGDTKELVLSPLQQFSADEGLDTVRALLPRTEAQADDVIEDLRELERVLAAAQQHGVGWHLEIDF